MTTENLYKDDWMTHFYANNDMRFMIRETVIVLRDQIEASRHEMLGRGAVKEARLSRIARRKIYALKLQSAIAAAIRS